MLISPRRGKSYFVIFRLFVVAISNRHAFLIFSFCHEGKEKSLKRYGKRVSIRQIFPQRKKEKEKLIRDSQLGSFTDWREKRLEIQNASATRRRGYIHINTCTHTQAAQESKVERETGQTQTAAFAVAATCKLLTTLL